MTNPPANEDFGPITPAFPVRRRGGGLALRLAIRATLTAAVAIVAAVMVESAVTRLGGESKGLQRQPPAMLKWAEPFQDRLRYVPVPGLALGIAALLSRRLRPVLAGLAMAASVLAMIIVVASLLAALAPMYQVPEELSLT